MPKPLNVEIITFPDGNRARVVRAPENVEAKDVMAALDLSVARALLILNGGTADLDPQVRQHLDGLYLALAFFVVENGITVITGGTDAGVFAVFGRALEKAGLPSAPCLGVTVAGRARLADLEPHHSHFVLVEGDDWGAGTPVMYRVAAAVAAGRPSLAVFAAGGPIVLKEMQENIEQNREMILISGSKGSSDAVAAVHNGAPTSDRDLVEISSRGQLTTFALDQKPEFLSLLIADRLLGV